MSQDLRAIAERNNKRVVEIRRIFHTNPHPAWEEDPIIDFIIKWVEEQAVRDSLALHQGKGGIWFDFVVNPGRPFVIFRADMDALKIEIDGKVHVIHACGHDCHTAGLLVAMCEIVKLRHPDRFPQNIRFVFQRAEEDYTAPQGSGGRVMVHEDGVCENVKAAVALHVWSGKPSGEFHTKSGPFLVNSDRLELRVQTKGGHAGMPHLADNALTRLTGLLPLIDRLPQALVAYDDGPAIISHTVLNSGGDISTANTVPTGVTSCWSIRTGTMKAKEALKKGLMDLLGNHLGGVSYRPNYIDGHPATVNDPDLVAKTAALLGEGVHTDHPVIPGGEDFGHIAAKVPAVFWMLGTGGIPGKTDIPHHRPNFDVDTSVLWKMVWFWLQMATNPLI